MSSSNKSKICFLVALVLATFFLTVFYANSGAQQSDVRKLVAGGTQWYVQKNTQRETIQLKSTVRIPNMKESLSFIDPDMSVQCEDIFKNKTSRDVIKNIYDELELYEKRVSDKVQELIKKRKRKSMMEGYCSKNPEETYIMSKLARWV